MTQTTVPENAAPSTRRLAIATVLALVVAAALLITTVLPAEYGIDPLGTGKALGLLDLYAGASPTASTSRAPANVERIEAKTVMPQSTMYKADAAVFTVRPFEGFEYKYRIEKGGGMVYSWKASGHVKYEFHGEPDGAGLGVAESYDKQEGDHASGTFTAPTSGIHGWFWENPSDAEITITLSSSGFYSKATEFRQKYDPVKHKDRVEEIPHPLSTANSQLSSLTSQLQISSSVMIRAVGPFDVKLVPQGGGDAAADAALGRMSIDKRFHGDLEATSVGQMLSAGTDVKGSAGYVAMEKVTGTLDRRHGTFVLQHSGTMTRGAPQLSISVVPDSGTGELTGLAGTMSISIADGKHSYDFEYTLPPRT